MRTGEAVCELSGHRGAVLDMVMRGNTGNVSLLLVNNMSLSLVKKHSEVKRRREGWITENFQIRDFEH